MNYLQQHRNPLHNLPGVGAVVLLHLALIYALVNGLGSAIVTKFMPPMTAYTVPETHRIQDPTVKITPHLNAPAHPNFIPHIDTQPLSTPLNAIVSGVDLNTQQYVPFGPLPHDESFSPSHIISGAAAPLYPEAYEEQAASGRVRVDCLIEVSGNPTQCTVLSVSGESAFAVETLRWLSGAAHPVYQPATHNGAAVAEHHQWEVNFEAP